MICLGAMPFGGTVDEQTSFAILDRFADAGGTFIDTANNYMFWHGTSDDSEELLGRWMRSRKNRDSLFLATKMGARPRTAGAGLEDAEGLSATAVHGAIDGSLRRLGTDRVDLYYAHVEDRSVPLEETLGAFARLVDAGAVGALGASNHATWRLAEARQVAAQHSWPHYTHYQGRHSYLRPRPFTRLNEAGHTQITDEHLDFARTYDVTVLAYASLLFGAYAHPDRMPEYYDHPGTTRRLETLRMVAAELDATANQVVLAWLIASGVTPLVGVSSVAQLDEALAARELKLDDDQLSRLDGAR